MAAAGTSARPHRRSVPLTVSVVLLAVATTAVLASLPARSALWLSVAAVLALALGWVSLRIMWSEVLETRRDHAADRAAADAAARKRAGAQAAEHTEFATAMTGRLAEAHLALHELEGLVTQHETRARNAESRLTDAQVRVRNLEQTLSLLPGGDAVVDLVAWDQTGQQVADRNTRRPAVKRA